MDKRANFERLRNKLKSDIFTSDHSNQQVEEIISENQKILDYVQSSSVCEIQENTQFIGYDIIKKQEKQHNSFKDHYQIGKILGEGAHAVVRQCWLINNPDDTYAVKITRSADPEIMEIMKQTFLNTISLNHPYICKAYRLFIDPNMESSNLVMEYLPYPSMEQLLKDRGKFSIPECQRYITQLLEAITYIHQMGICHRDLKPDNIVIDTDQNIVKLIDFGVSKRYTVTEKGNRDIKTQMMWTVTGNLRYQAPELWIGTGYSNSIDIWAVGVIAYQMLCGSLPLNQQCQMEYFETDLPYTKHLDDQNFLQLPKIVRDFVKRLMSWLPERRVSAREALLHPWLYVVKKIPKQIKLKKSYYLTRDDSAVGIVQKVQQQGLVRSMQAALKLVQQSQNMSLNVSVIESSLDGKKEKKIGEFKKRCFLDAIHLGPQETSQQMRDRSIHFQQSIKSINLSRSIKPSTQEDIIDFFDVIKVCDSNTSFESLEDNNKQPSQQPIQNLQKNPNYNSQKIEKLRVIKEEPETPIPNKLI